jgi:hypothetical protein
MAADNLALDEIEFRRVLAGPSADGRQVRDAIDIEINGRSLSHLLGAAPFDVDDVRSLGLARAWSQPGSNTPILNCPCGDIGCGGFTVDVEVEGETVTWRGARLERSLSFAGPALRASLQAALAE